MQGPAVLNSGATFQAPRLFKTPPLYKAGLKLPRLMTHPLAARKRVMISRFQEIKSVSLPHPNAPHTKIKSITAR
jgi:hypothetical protein